MNVTLPSELEERIQASVARGDYENSEALVQEAVRRLVGEDGDDLDALRETLRARDAKIERGSGLEFDRHTASNLAGEVNSRGRRRIAGLGDTRTSG